MSGYSPTRAPGSSEFPQTRWTLILSSRDNPATRRAALEEVLAAYWKPLYLYARRKGLDSQSASDLIQGFCIRLIEQDFLARLSPEKGKCRAYLKTAMNHFLLNEREREMAKKRGGEAKALSLDVEKAEGLLADTRLDPEAAFERDWALETMQRAMDALRREFESGERQGPFAIVAAFFRPEGPPPYAELQAQFGMSEAKLKSFLHRARHRFRELLQEEIAQTVDEPAAAGQELELLLQSLAR